MTALFSKSKKYLLALLIGAFIVPGSSVYAQSTELKAALKAVARSVDEAADQLPKKDAEVKRESEDAADARRTAIGSILDLTAAEIDDLLDDKKLQAVIDKSDISLSAAATELRTRLMMYRGYVGLVRAQLASGIRTAEEIKAIAAGLKEWREEVYEPVVRQAMNSVLVSQSAAVIETSNRRLDKVSLDVRKVQSTKGAASTATIASLLSSFEAARGHIASAGKYHEAARTLLIKEHEELFKRAVNLASNPRTVILARGSLGDFVCMPGTSPSRAASCPLAYKRSIGGFYELRTSDGEGIFRPASELAQIKGLAFELQPLFATDEIVGIVYVQSVNRVGEDIFMPILRAENADPLSASASDALRETPTVSSLVRQSIEAVNRAYKEFFAMSKKLQQAR
jgi:hypothetical protein